MSYFLCIFIVFILTLTLIFYEMLLPKYVGHFTSYTKGCCFVLSLFSFYRYCIDRHTDLERQFNINVEDGKITLAKPLDRETDMWHNITVTATEVRKFNFPFFLLLIETISVLCFRVLV